MPELAPVGRVVKAHALRGAVIARPAADGSDVLLRVDAVLLSHQGSVAPRKVLSAQWQGRQVLLQLEGCRDRNAAEALVGAELLLEADRLPPPDDDEYYVDALIGLPVIESTTGHNHGTVAGVESAPGIAWLQVATARGTVLVPMAAGLVTVDMPGRRVVVSSPEGLFDLVDGGLDKPAAISSGAKPSGAKPSGDDPSGS